MINLSKDVDECFSDLIENFGFEKRFEKIGDQGYSVTLYSKKLTLRIETYRKDIYMYGANSSLLDDEVNLFTLFAYLRKDSQIQIEPNHFPKIKNERKRFRSQLAYDAKIVVENLEEIICFFSQKDLKKEIGNIRSYVIAKYPTLFQQHKSKL